MHSLIEMAAPLVIGRGSAVSSIASKRPSLRLPISDGSGLAHRNAARDGSQCASWDVSRDGIIREPECVSGWNSVRAGALELHRTLTDDMRMRSIPLMSSCQRWACWWLEGGVVPTCDDIPTCSRHQLAYRSDPVARQPSLMIACYVYQLALYHDEPTGASAFRKVS